MKYTVVLNSLKNSGTGTDPLNKATRYYNIDWSFLPQGKKYKVSFTFRTTKWMTTTGTGDIIAILNVNFSGSPNTYEAVSTGGRPVSNFLGVLNLENTGSATDQRLIARLNDNPPIFINDRPSNNNFLVQMYKLDGSAFVTSTTATLEYVLTLSFEEMD